MVNTVIGDNVNSASRLEGLTRFYRSPVICSEYVKDEVAAHSRDFDFMELDLVQVKGKTKGKKIFWPIPKDQVDAQLKSDVEEYKQGLHLYYRGEWPEAFPHFERCSLAAAGLFRNRIKDREAPTDWNGVWTMKEK